MKTSVFLEGTSFDRHCDRDDRQNYSLFREFSEDKPNA